MARLLGDAPVIEVSGRMYPVEVRYRPLADPDRLFGGLPGVSGWAANVVIGATASRKEKVSPGATTTPFR